MYINRHSNTPQYAASLNAESAPDTSAQPSSLAPEASISGPPSPAPGSPGSRRQPVVQSAYSDIQRMLQLVGQRYPDRFDEFAELVQRTGFVRELSPEHYNVQPSLTSTPQEPSSKSNQEGASQHSAPRQKAKTCARRIIALASRIGNLATFLKNSSAKRQAGRPQAEDLAKR